MKQQTNNNAFILQRNDGRFYCGNDLLSNNIEDAITFAKRKQAKQQRDRLNTKNESNIYKIIAKGHNE